MKKHYTKKIIFLSLLFCSFLTSVAFADWNDAEEGILGDVSTENIDWASSFELAPKLQRTDLSEEDAIDESYFSRGLEIVAGVASPIFRLYGSAILNSVAAHGPSYVRQLIAVSHSATMPASVDPDLYVDGGVKIEALAAPEGTLKPACVNDFGRLMHCPE